MKKIYMFFFISLTTLSQTIEGTVLDQNKKPIVDANIYLDGTTWTTRTDQNGSFILDINKKINTTLIIKHMGYGTQIIQNPFDNQPLTIVLIKKEIVLNEVVITTDYFTRKQKLKIFREVFLGTTKAGQSCKISNEDDIFFRYDYKTSTLYATSDVSLKVENSYLGYHIEFDLHEFKIQFTKKSINKEDVYKSLYLGTTLYTDIWQEKKSKKTRDKVYLGSAMHFFKTLSNKSWGENNFILFKKSFPTNPNLYFTIIEEGNMKKITINKVSTTNKETNETKVPFSIEFGLMYKKSQQSHVQFLTDTFYVDEYGNNSDIDKIAFSGELGEKKLGDLLPMDYRID